MSFDRKIMRELRMQGTIKTRLQQADTRNGLWLNPQVTVSFETLVQVRDQIEKHLASQMVPGATLN